MATIDYERKYKALVEAAKTLKEANPSDDGIQKWVKDNVPELQESEDEKIRKDIIATIHLYYGEPLEDEAKEMIAWVENTQYAIDHAKREGFQLGYKAGIEKQGEQRPLYSQEVMDIAIAKDFEQDELKHVFDIKTSEESLSIDSDAHNNIVDECIYNEQKSSWSEEDERIYKSIIYASEHNYPLNKIQQEFIRTLKKRVQPQNSIVTDEELIQAKKEAYNDALNKIEYHSGEPSFDDGWSAATWYFKKRNMQPQSKQEWSEEDDIMIHDIDYALRCQIAYPIPRLQSMSVWILNLKNRVQPQSQWKPSDEQIQELGIVATGKGWFNKEILSKLLEQLKNLKEK